MSTNFTQQALDEFRQHKNLILSMPCGLPRMELLEAMLSQRLAAHERILYIGSRIGALEIQRRIWLARFPNHEISLFAKDYEPGHNAAARREVANILLYSVEKLNATLQKDPSHNLASCGLIIADDLDLLETPRGPVLEMALMNLLEAGQSQVVALARSTDTTQAAAWLNAKALADNSYITPSIVPVANDTHRKQQLLQLLGPAPQHTIIFARTPRRARDLALQLYHQGVRAASHHSNLAAERQATVEEEFQQGKIDVVVCTATLVGSTYLGAETVIVFDDEIYDASLGQRVRNDRILFSQIAHASERAYLLQSSTGPTVLPTPPRLCSTLNDAKHAARVALRGLHSAEDTIGYARSLVPDNALRQQTLSKLVQQKMIACQYGQLNLTSLGEIARQYFLPTETIAHYDALLSKAGPLGFLDLLLLAALAPGFTPHFYVAESRTSVLLHQLNGSHSRLLQGDTAAILDRLQTTPTALCHAISAALIARDMVRGHSKTQIVQTYQLYSAQMERLLIALRRLIPLLANLAALHTECHPTTTAGRAHALNYLLAGLPVSAIELAYLDIPLERINTLRDKGYLSLSQIADALDKDVSDVMPRARLLLKAYPEAIYGTSGHIAGLPPIAPDITLVA